MSWISVEDESPPYAEYVLCFTNDKIYSLGIYLYGGGWSLDEDVINDDYVTHWMKLPEPPGREEIQMQIVKESIARLESMSRSEFLSVLAESGVIESNQSNKNETRNEN